MYEEGHKKDMYVRYVKKENVGLRWSDVNYEKRDDYIDSSNERIKIDWNLFR